MEYSIFLSTTDFFEDVWNPFFILFKKFWPSYNGKIFMSTEYKDYAFADLNIIPLKVSEKNHVQRDKQAAWGQRMKWAIESVDTDILLFLEEDFLFKDYVKTEYIDEYVDIMVRNPNIKCIYLTDKGAHGKKSCKEYENLCYVGNVMFRVNCQAALWRKEELLALLETDESIWEFEIFGTKRSCLSNKIYLSVNRNWVKYDDFEIIPYLWTGIFRGKWNPDVKQLFEKSDIKIDYDIRGVNSCSEDVISFSKRIRNRIIRFPKYMRYYKNLLLGKWKLDYFLKN